MVAIPKASGLRFGSGAPARWVSLLFSPNAYFFCHGFYTSNPSYSIFLVFALHLVARYELIDVDNSDDCSSKSTITFDAHLGWSGEFQTLLHNLCYCSWTFFNDVCIIDNIFNLVRRSMGGQPPRR